jgi:hypothetical protein
LCQQCGPGGERARGSRLRLTRGRLTGQERRNLGVESLPFPLYRVERLTMLRDALLVQAHQGRHGTGGSAKLFTAVAPEEQTGVAGSSTLVDIHELRLQVRELRQSLRFKLLEIIGGLCDRSLALGHGRFGLAHTLDLDLAVDLELAEVAKQRARLANQGIGFVLQCLNTIVDSTGCSLSATTFGRLAGEAGAERNHQDDGERTRTHVGEG